MEKHLEPKSLSFEYGGKEITLETGRIARQATAAVLVTVDQTQVLTTVVAKKEADPGKDFFPLAVFYQEKFYAAGKIPGGYFKREARPTEKETLTSRLIDRPIRPLFPDEFKNDVQIMSTVISSDEEFSSDIAAMIGASAALSLSGVPFQGPIGAARVGFIDGSYALNPSKKIMDQSFLDMVVAGTSEAVLMVESEASELNEDLMLGAVLFGHKSMQIVIDKIKEFRELVGVEDWIVEKDEETPRYFAELESDFSSKIEEAFTIAKKSDRSEAINAVRLEILEKYEDLDELATGKVMSAFKKLESQIVRKNILSGKPRIDGRDLNTVRQLTVETDVLNRAHGSALFTRGETQALVAATLASPRDAQRLESLDGEEHDHFMLHYNFPAYCVGEIGMPMGPKRREIGHGNLAKRAIKGVLPDFDDFGYTVRIVMDIKIDGINEKIMDEALTSAKDARMHILEKMNEVLSKPKELASDAPSMQKFMVNKDKIKEIIGKGGAVIKSIQEESGAVVDINDTGEISVFGDNQAKMQAALDIIDKIIEEPEVDKVYEGTVVKIVDFGAFVNILPGKDGLLHISEISEERTEDVSAVLEEGQKVTVKLIGFDRGKMKLSIKALSK